MAPSDASARLFRPLLTCPHLWFVSCHFHYSSFQFFCPILHFPSLIQLLLHFDWTEFAAFLRNKTLLHVLKEMISKRLVNDSLSSHTSGKYWKKLFQSFCLTVCATTFTKYRIWIFYIDIGLFVQMNRFLKLLDEFIW